MSDPWPSVDPLGEVLHVLRMSNTLYASAHFTAPWALEMPPLPDVLMVHVVNQGEAWVEVAGVAPRLLRPGDLALVPHGAGHRLAVEPDAPGPGLFDIPREQVSERYEIIRHGGGGAPANMICGVIRFDHPAARHLISLLPPLIMVEGENLPQPDWLRSTLRFVADEARTLRPGGETVITRLADVLVIQAIRSWIEQDPAAQQGWLGALRDRQIGRAITLMHRDPAHPWSVASLADEVAMSRSAFAARFAGLVGEPPMQYLTRWRMSVAESWLTEDTLTLSEIAHRLGYQSEAAFSRAFKRLTGHAPGTLRRHRALPTAPE